MARNVRVHLYAHARCGHTPALEKPQELVRAVREFLAKRDTAVR